MPRARALAFSLALSLAPGLAFAADPAFSLTIRDHKFEPETLEVPAGQKFVLTVINADATPEEFESSKLKREKVVAGGKQIEMTVGPLTPGTYDFFGDFHPKTTRGKIIAK